MKLNKDKVATFYSARLNEGEFIEGSFDLLEYGWYNSGKAFIAKNGRVMSFVEAYRELVPKCSLNLYNAFFVDVTKYKKTIDGIVRYLIDKYNS
jgi:hypothetical protein